MAALQCHADAAARRARGRHPVPVLAVQRVEAVDDLARRALRAAAEAVEEAAAALPRRRRPAHLRGQQG